VDEYLTIGLWRAKDGREAELVEVWKGIGEVFNGLPDPPTGTGTLVQSIEDPRSFVSFGAWPSLSAIRAMREDDDARRAIGRMAEVCEDTRPGTFRVVATVPAGEGA
jgi:hypothetical protein